MYLGQCLQMQSDLQDGNKVRSDVTYLHGGFLILKLVGPRTIQAVQTHRAPVFKFLPVTKQCIVKFTSKEFPKGRHAGNGRPPR